MNELEEDYFTLLKFVEKIVANPNCNWDKEAKILLKELNLNE